MSKVSKETLAKISRLFDCNSTEVLLDHIEEIIGLDGSSMSRIYIVNVDNLRFVVKIMFFRKETIELLVDSDDRLPTPDVDLETMLLLKREILQRGITPCIIELLHSHRCSGMHVRDSDCKRVLSSQIYPTRNRVIADDLQAIICRHNDMVKHNISHDRCTYFALEYCSMTFTKYLSADATPMAREVFKSLLLQIIHALACLQEVYPGFMHGDLHCDNVLLRVDTTFDPTERKYIALKHGGRTIYVPYFGIICKMIDFEFSYIPTLGIKSVRMADPGYIYHNQAGDICKLFRWIDIQKPLYSDILGQLMPSRAYMDQPAELSGGEIVPPKDMFQHKIWNCWAGTKKVARANIIATYGL